MEEEKEQITKRLERVKKRVDSVNNSNQILEMSRNYRMEVEREEKINQQKSDLKSELNGLDQKIDRLEKILKEQQSSYHDLNPESNSFDFYLVSYYFGLGNCILKTFWKNLSNRSKNGRGKSH